MSHVLSNKLGWKHVHVTKFISLAFLHIKVWVGRVPSIIFMRSQKFPSLFISPTLFDSLFHYLPRTGESMPATSGLQRTILRLCPKASTKRCATIGMLFVVTCFCVACVVHLINLMFTFNIVFRVEDCFGFPNFWRAT